MGIRIEFHDDEFKRQMGKALAAGLQRAGIYFHTKCVQAVNKSNVHRHRAKFTARQSAARGGQKTGTVYENMGNAYEGQPPFKRTGFGQSNIVYEYNENPLMPAVRVGVRANAMYMFFLELGTGRIKPRPWLKTTFDQCKPQLVRLALSGFKR